MWRWTMFMLRSSAVALTVFLAASPQAQTDTKQIVPDEYTGTTTHMTPGAGTKLSIQVLRWSSDSDREGVVSVVNSKAEDGQTDAGKALADLPTVGYVWLDGPLGYALKYAHRATLSDGGERIVVLTYPPLGSWEYPPWKGNGQNPATSRPFSVVELHINRKGTGSGRMSLTTPVTVDEDTNTLGLANFETTPASLIDVRRQPKPSWAHQE